MWQKFVWMALAGGLGALARYGLSGLVYRINGVSFPWGTVVVNISGCFIAGLLWALFEYRLQISAETRLIVMVGLMGAFTTFSTFVLETGELLRQAQYVLAAGNIILQNGLGVVALFAGIALGRMA